MKAGTRITVRSHRIAGTVEEPATVVRTQRCMLPLPDGYLPVRFDCDGALLLIGRDRITVVEGAEAP